LVICEYGFTDGFIEVAFYNLGDVAHTVARWFLR
jgi:hypothetical protein